MNDTEAPYDLRMEPWIPWRRRSGRVEWGSISMLTRDIAGDPVVALAAPRPDFNGALTEFLIGMLTVALLPRDERDWKEWWDQPPTPDALERALKALPDAFRLNGSGPRLLQDFREADLKKEILPVERLLFDAPGEETVSDNKDLFVKRARVAGIGPAASAMALITMQTYAPSGGKGHRVSMRGGGPLTTLVDPRSDPGGECLWRYLWANVETNKSWKERAPSISGTAMASLFPWLGPTRQSSNEMHTTPADGHPLQAYFGMPRRLRLIFDGAGRCDITGLNVGLRAVGYRVRSHGVKYDSWLHPMSPYYYGEMKSKKSGNEGSSKQCGWLPIHPQSDGVGWKDWYGLTVENGERRKSRPAQVVGHFKSQRARVVGVRMPRIRAFGVNFVKNMKCRSWVEAAIPLFIAESEIAQVTLQEAGGRLTRATEVAAAALRMAIKSVVFAVPEDSGGDFALASAELWAATEGAFYAALGRLADHATDGESAHNESVTFQRELATATLAVFDRWCPLDSVATTAIRRAVSARYSLKGTLSGHGKMGMKLFSELQMAPPEGSAKRPRASTIKRGVSA